jgi:CheY-like chemotaxis protein
MGHVVSENTATVFHFCKRQSVLIVDDNRDSADSLAMVLELWGYQPVVAFDGASGIELAKLHCPSVALLDIGLPGGLNGYELAKTLRDECDFDDALVVAITGYGQEEDRQKSFEAGFDHHFRKPVDLDVLQQLLKDFFATGKRPGLSVSA